MFDPTRIVDVKLALGAIGDVVFRAVDDPEADPVATDLGPGVLLDIAPELMADDLLAFVVTPPNPVHDFGDCVRLRFPTLADACSTSLSAAWIQVDAI